MIKKYSSQPSAYRRDSQQELKKQHIFILHTTIIITYKPVQKTFMLEKEIAILSKQKLNFGTCS